MIGPATDDDRTRLTAIGPSPDDDRAVSIAITHVLAIGITTLLVSTLLIGASGVLDEQKERAARGELDTIGNRVATQMTTAARIADDGSETQFLVRQPTRVSGGTYTLSNESASACDAASVPPTADPDSCLVLETTNLNVEVTVPVHLPGDATVNVEVIGSGEILVEATP
jgi:hypothetical protein